MLTDREREVWGLICRLAEERGFPPTIREIGDAAGIRSTNGVRYFLNRLEAKGYLRLNQGLSRGIELLQEWSRPGSSPGGREPVSVPMLGRVAAGHPVLSEEHVEDTLLLDPSLVGHGKVFALRVRGESMKDAGILEGDTVIVRMQPEARPGEVVVALVDGEATVKTYRTRKGRVVLEPANEAFSPIEVGPDQEFQLVGKVVAVLRKLEG